MPWPKVTWEAKGLFPPIIPGHSPPLRERRTGVEVETEAVQVSGSLTDHSLIAFLYSSGPPTGGIVLLTLGPTLGQSIQQVMIKKFPSDIGHRTILSGHFFLIEVPSSQVTPVWFKLKIKTTQHAWFMTSSIGLPIVIKMRCPHASPKYQHLLVV